MLRKTPSGEPFALVTNIQKYTIHDGPGIRTAVFFKGCPLRCLWCGNPETLDPRAELGVYPSKCLTREKCGHCAADCPESASPLEFDESGTISAVRTNESCADCMKCAQVCPSRAIKRWGEELTLSVLMTEITRDRSFYQKTGGGVTLSGGEVMLQWEFAELLLRACKDASIGTCVESALFCPPEHMEAVLRHADVVITDIKHMDSDLHRQYTGVPNELILSNIRRVSEMGKPLVVRTPVVDGYTGSEENLRNTGRFLAGELGGRIVQYQLLPYKRLGTEKYESLRLPYPLEDYKAPERALWEEKLLRAARLLRSEYGLPAVAGTGERLSI